MYLIHRASNQISLVKEGRLYESHEGDLYRDTHEYQIDNHGNSDWSKIHEDMNTFIRFTKGGSDESCCIKVNITQPSKIKVLAFVSNMNDDKVQLYDGRSGKPYNMKSMCGTMYAIKSRHQGSHKIVARGIDKSNRYNINGSPTQGKADEGGQRLGEMEMWSLNEHGCINILNEILTFKTDDKSSREILRNASKSSGSSEMEYGLVNIEQTQKNSPYIYKMIDSNFRSSFIKPIYYNPNGEEINIYTEITNLSTEKDKNGRDSKVVKVNNRNQSDIIRQQRIKVHENIKEAMLKRYGSSLADKLRSYDINVSNTFGVTDDMDVESNEFQEILEGSCIAPINGYNENYYLFGINCSNSYETREDEYRANRRNAWKNICSLLDTADTEQDMESSYDFNDVFDIGIEDMDFIGSYDEEQDLDLSGKDDFEIIGGNLYDENLVVTGGLYNESALVNKEDIADGIENDYEQEETYNETDKDDGSGNNSAGIDINEAEDF